ncbi:MAG: carbohydrate ABC transporter permease [Clostridiales bacterium]|jgi:putative aldouronate transport system permease protein|nr:carbohydrate ABC transporter permease [Clostridiales bacterium]
MKVKKSLPGRIFSVANSIFLLMVAFICILPFINVLAISFSSKIAVTSGEVVFWPVGFTVNAYEFITKSSAFTTALGVSLRRTILGVAVNVMLIVMTAYPLSKPVSQFRGRNALSWYFVLTILFSGGLIPSYMMVRYTGLMDKLWALVIPGALPVFSMLVVMNYMRSLPAELEEAAYMDGATHIRSLIHIVLPISTPTIATVTLFSFVGHWNSWFDGLIYMNATDHYPLQSYLQTVVTNPEQFFRSTSNLNSELMTMLALVNSRTANAAQLFLATVPILAVYPFLQKYFTAGLVLGSVKG